MSTLLLSSASATRRLARPLSPGQPHAEPIRRKLTWVLDCLSRKISDRKRVAGVLGFYCESVSFRQLCQLGCCCKKRPQPRNLIVTRCRWQGRRLEAGDRRQETELRSWLSGLTVSRSSASDWGGKGDHSFCHLSLQSRWCVSFPGQTQSEEEWKSLTRAILTLHFLWVWSPSLLTPGHWSLR